MDSNQHSYLPHEHDFRQSPLNGWKIIRLALWSEGALFFLSLPWMLATKTFVSVSPLTAITTGIIATIPLLLTMSGVSRVAEEWGPLQQSPFGKQLQDLQCNFIFPLSRALNNLQILIIALISGIGEEVFFRGLLPWLLEDISPQIISFICSSFLFALLHFVGSFHRFSRLLSIYFIAGIYLSFLYIHYESIVVPITCHACFNFVSLVLNRRRALATTNEY